MKKQITYRQLEKILNRTLIDEHHFIRNVDLDQTVCIEIIDNNTIIIDGQFYFI